MTLAAELAARRSDRFLALILDNEVTVGEFVTQPPLHWTRCIQRNDVFQVAEGYPTLLTEAQATLEMRNWDDVSLKAISLHCRRLVNPSIILSSAIMQDRAYRWRRAYPVI